MDNKIGIRKWLSFLLAGFVGQIAWAIENNYLNLFVYHTSPVDAVATFIPLMTALSAVTATVTTLFMGALSDRLGKRKLFISFGYIIWGLSIILFAFLDPTSKATLIANNSAFLAGSMIVVADCIMTFFGSTANDAAFNAYVTDNTNSNNRGKVEAVLSILPLFAVIIVVVPGKMIVDGLGWDMFFYIFGAVTTVIGFVCLFLFPQENLQPNKDEPYLKNIIYGFRPKVVKENPKLYLALISFMVFNIAIQVFMPYLMVYIEQTLNVDFIITVASVIGTASIVTVVIGAFMDKLGKNRIIFPALAAATIGGVLMTFLTDQVGVIIGCTLLMAGYLICTAVLGAKVRDYTPINQAGLFQGVRMVFVVMIPMVTGPYIGSGVSNINRVEYFNEDYQMYELRPNNLIFLFTAIVLVLALIPIIFLIRKEKADDQQNQQAAE